MQTATVLTLAPKATVRKSAARKSKGKAAIRPVSWRRLDTGSKVRVVAFFGLALCGLGVSLPHLASEIGALTGSAVVAAWLVALTVDLGMVATKAHISARGPSRRVAWTVLGTCTLVSIVLNCHAFYGAASPGFGQWAAIGFGIFLPLFILALSYLGSEIMLGKKG